MFVAVARRRPYCFLICVAVQNPLRLEFLSEKLSIALVLLVLRSEELLASSDLELNVLLRSRLSSASERLFSGEDDC